MLEEHIEYLSDKKTKKEFYKSYLAPDFCMYNKNSKHNKPSISFTLNGAEIKRGDTDNTVITLEFCTTKTQNVKTALSLLKMINKHREKLLWMYEKTLEIYNQNFAEIITQIMAENVHLLENNEDYAFHAICTQIRRNWMIDKVFDIIYNDSDYYQYANISGSKEGIWLNNDFHVYAPESEDRYVVKFKDGITDKMLVEAIENKDVSEIVLWYYDLYKVIYDPERKYSIIQMKEDYD